MFGFFKKDTKPPPAPTSSRLGPPPVPGAAAAPSYDAVLLASIIKLRAGDQTVLSAFFESLSHVTVSVATREPRKLATTLMLEHSGDTLIAVFTKAQLAEPWQAHGYSHLMTIPMRELAAQVSSDTVGLTINPDHPIFGYPLPPAGFKHFREVLASLIPPLREGGIYHARNDDGTFSVLKILKLDDGGVHLRQYSNVWPAPPVSVDEATLYMAGMDRKPGEKLGMGHMPVSTKNFAGWNTKFVQQSSVSEQELEGYKMWLEANGGYF